LFILEPSVGKQHLLNQKSAEVPISDSQDHNSTETASPTQARSVLTDENLCIQFYEHTCGCKKADSNHSSSPEYFAEMRKPAL